MVRRDARAEFDQEQQRRTFEEARAVGAEILQTLDTIPEAQILLEEGLVRAYDNSARDTSWLPGLLHGALSRPIDVVRRTTREKSS